MIVEVGGAEESVAVGHHFQCAAAFDDSVQFHIKFFPDDHRHHLLRLKYPLLWVGGVKAGFRADCR